MLNSAGDIVDNPARHFGRRCRNQRYKDAEDQSQRDYPRARVPNDAQHRRDILQRLETFPPSRKEGALLFVLYAVRQGAG